MEKNYFKILKTLTGQTYQLPIFLDEKIDNMGVMVEFDGEIEQIEQFCNFTYSGYGQTLVIYNTVNTNKLKTLVDSEFNINWGDGNYSGLTMTNVWDDTLSSVSHTYNNGVTGSTVEITLNSPWKVNKIKRRIVLPLTTINDYVNDLDTLTFDIPYSNITGVTQNYKIEKTVLTGKTNINKISFVAIGKSRLSEYKIYGTGNTYTISTITGNTVDLGNYISYSIDGLTYFDYVNGYTHITGSTSGTTTYPYVNHEVYNGMLTREEMLIGFVNEPQIYSDIFVDRGKQSVMERNIRLGEIDNMGELEIYGGGYFNVKKQ